MPALALALASSSSIAGEGAMEECVTFRFPEEDWGFDKGSDPEGRIVR